VNVFGEVGHVQRTVG